MNIDPSDVKLLQIFVAVVDSNGVANAQTALNKDASTISRALGQLEDRLHLRLCERGRHGFSLTAEGREVYEEAVKLLISLRGLEQKIAGLNRSGAGGLNLGIIDNIIMDETCPLGPALRVFNADSQPRLLVNLQVETPADLEKRILDRRLDIALGIFEGKNDYIEYRPLYRETDHLYCAPGSPLGQMVLAGRAEADILNLLNRQHFVSRKFLNQRELAWLEPKSDEQVCYASNLEAVLFIILSGQSVGFVPEHFARRWVCKGELIAVLPDNIRHQSVIEAAFLKTAGAPRPIIASFLKTLFADLP